MNKLGVSWWPMQQYSKDTPYNDQRANTIFNSIKMREDKRRVGKYEMNSKPMKDTKPNSILNQKLIKLLQLNANKVEIRQKFYGIVNSVKDLHFITFGL